MAKEEKKQEEKEPERVLSKEEQNREECSKRITEILNEYGYNLSVVGFCLVPKK